MTRVVVNSLSPSFSPNIIGGAKVIFSYGSFSVKRIDIQKVSIGIHSNYIGAMNSSIAIDNDIEEYVGNSSKPYSIASLNMRVSGMRLKRKKKGHNESGLFMNVKLSNIFNTTYFYPTTTNAQWALNGIQGRGTSLLLTLGYAF